MAEQIRAAVVVERVEVQPQAARQVVITRQVQALELEAHQAIQAPLAVAVGVVLTQEMLVAQVAHRLIGTQHMVPQVVGAEAEVVPPLALEPMEAPTELEEEVEEDGKVLVGQVRAVTEERASLQFTTRHHSLVLVPQLLMRYFPFKQLQQQWQQLRYLMSGDF